MSHGYTKPGTGFTWWTEEKFEPAEILKFEPAEILGGTTKNRGVVFLQFAPDESYTSTNIRSQPAEEGFSQLNKSSVRLLTDLLTSLRQLNLIFSQLKGVSA